MNDENEDGFELFLKTLFIGLAISLLLVPLMNLQTSLDSTAKQTEIYLECKRSGKADCGKVPPLQSE